MVIFINYSMRLKNLKRVKYKGKENKDPCA